MNFLATSTRRKILFASLYYSEGAPVGFLWVALLTRLKVEGFSTSLIGWLSAVLVIPWTFKFAWAPLIDVFSSRRWTYRHWILSSQSVMALALLPLLLLDLHEHFSLIVGFLILHAFAAATQDVSIDALCISVTVPQERGSYNGWMQTGVMLGRASLGGGALIMAAVIGHTNVVLLLIVAIAFSMLMVIGSRTPQELGKEPLSEDVMSDPLEDDSSAPRGMRIREVGRELLRMLSHRNTWIGMAFAFLGGAAFKALEVWVGPFLTDRGFTEVEIGTFTALPMIGCMIAGALTGGFLADRFTRRFFVGLSLLGFVLPITALAASDLLWPGERGGHLLVLMALTAFAIGLFTAASYALFMDISSPAIAATQFSAFMGATNGCESWSSYSLGKMVSHWGEASGYAFALLVLCGVSLLSLSLLALLKPGERQLLPDRG